MLQREIVGQILPLFSGFVFVLGTVVGSFLNVVVWRLPRGESLSHPGSHCPKCGHAIRPWENIPILSWLVLRARCSHCGLPISMRYPLVELANGLLFLVLWERLWNSAMPLSTLWGYLFLGSALLAASLIDIEHYLIPDAITFVGMGVAVLLAVWFPETHLGPGLTGLPGSEQLVTGAMLRGLGRVGSYIASVERLAAVVDAMLGLAVGYLMLRLLLEAGRRLWGRVRVREHDPVEARISTQGVCIEDAELDAVWEDLLIRSGDEFRCHALDLTEVGRGAIAGGGLVEIRVTRSTLAIGTEVRPLAQVGALSARLTAWEFPREVMGHGDLKLLAMVGAFLGPDATVFALMWGAFLGCAWGLGRNVASPSSRRAPLPFGPFLAAGALLWTVFGEGFVRWYGGLLAS